VTGQPLKAVPAPEPQSQPTLHTGDINITIHGNVSGNVVVGSENQVNTSRDENKPKG